ncbi:MAG: XRE family transcriptional regulator [Negativicutes bacterium]|nr:XRE family transcriptional regulator [Negativicutes bacterium]
MNKDIGQKVKDLRVGKRLTLKNLSEMTNLSTGFLSQLERGLTAIATDSLAAIAQALDVELAYFFVKPTVDGQYVFRSYERDVLRIESSRFIHYRLSSAPADKRLLTRLVELLPINSQEPISPYPHEGEEFVYVLEGTLTLFINQERFELFPGDTAHYASNIVHNWANYTNKLVRLLVVSVPNPLQEGGHD